MAKTSRALVLTAALVILVPVRGTATQRYGPLEISGNLQTQNLVRHPDDEHFQFIQNRNTAHLQFEYDWVQAGKFYDKYTIPIIERSLPFVKYRGVYHGLSHTTPATFEEEDGPGRAHPGATLF